MKILNSVLVIGFLAADFLMFHDLGEPHTFVEYLIGALSVLVFVGAAYALIGSSRSA